MRRFAFVFAVACFALAPACEAGGNGVPPGAAGDIGKACGVAAECAGNHCLPPVHGNYGDPGYCSRACSTNDDCVVPGWECRPDSNGVNLCQCSNEDEIFDGKDNDCNGIVDENFGQGAGCFAGLTSCNAGPCVDLQTDRFHCGACGHACGSHEVCAGGTCVCPGGSRCGSECQDLQHDPSNCGSCGHVCGASQICDNGLCQCGLSGWVPCNGVCAHLEDDNRNCGACNVVCPADKVCVAGKCGDCPKTMLHCGDKCVSPLDPENCGECGYTCGKAHCDGRACSCLGGPNGTTCYSCNADAACTLPATFPGPTSIFYSLAAGTKAIWASIVIASDRQVVRFDKATQARTLVHEGQGLERSIVAGDGAADFAYAADASGPNPSQIVACPNEACGAPLVTDVMPLALAVHAGHAYWVSPSWTVERCPLAGCVGAPESVGTLLGSVPAAGTAVAFLVDASGAYVAASNGLQRVVAGTPTVGLALVTGAAGLAADDQFLYVTDHDQSFQIVAKSGTPATTWYVTGQLGHCLPGSVVTDGAFVYWLASAHSFDRTANLWKCPAKAPCTTPTRVFDGISKSSYLPLGRDANAFYVGAGTLVRIPK